MSATASGEGPLEREAEQEAIAGATERAARGEGALVAVEAAAEPGGQRA